MMAATERMPRLSGWFIWPSDNNGAAKSHELAWYTEDGNMYVIAPVYSTNRGAGVEIGCVPSFNTKLWERGSASVVHYLGADGSVVDKPRLFRSVKACYRACRKHYLRTAGVDAPHVVPLTYNTSPIEASIAIRDAKYAARFREFAPRLAPRRYLV